MFKKTEEGLKQSQIDTFLRRKTNLKNTSVIELSSEDDHTPLKSRDPVRNKENLEMSSNPVGGKSLFTFKTPKQSSSLTQLSTLTPTPSDTVEIKPKKDEKTLLASLENYELPSFRLNEQDKANKIQSSSFNIRKPSSTPSTSETSEITKREKISSENKISNVKPTKELKPLPGKSRVMQFLDNDSDDDDNDKNQPKKETQSLFSIKKPVAATKSSKVDDLKFSSPSTSSTISKPSNSSSFTFKSTQKSDNNSQENKTVEIMSPSSSGSEKITIVSTPVEEIKSQCIKIDSGQIIKDYEILKEGKIMDMLDHQQLINEQLKFYKYYYEIHNQIPLSNYENIEGYDKSIVVKIKSMISNLNLRIKRKESSNQIASLVNGIKAKNKPTQHPDEDQFDVEEIMQDIQREKQISSGTYDNNYVDLSSPSTSSFQPRINMKSATNYSSQSAQPSSSINVDEDGWEVFDYTPIDKVNSSHSSSYNKQRDSIEFSIPDEPESNQPDLDNSSIGKFHEDIKNDGITGEFDKTYSFSQEIRHKFRETFGLREFRQNQLQAINATLMKEDCFILMPTGGGKSLCYQLPAVVSEGVTIVVSPLKSLIYDQVNKLNTLDIKAAALSGDMSNEDARKIYSDINCARPTIKLLYITPEKISASAFLQETFENMSKRGTLARFVIDEAHCVSTWGHDFRPDYKKLGELKKRFQNVPVMALTATANQRVRADVVHQLNIPRCKWFLSSFNRPNLKYMVMHKKGSSTLNDIIGLIKAKYSKASGIIYCLSRKDCETTAEKLKLAKIEACFYHAGMSDKVREQVQLDWITDKFKVVCATIAFGMGIDKPDVRYVIHYSLPKSIEGYYQEAGRAGRDGKISTCILYYNYGDKVRYLNMISKEPPACQKVSRDNLDLVVNFCENMVDCRRSVILNYFGEHFTREQCLQNEATACDNCKRTDKYKIMNVTDIGKKMVNAVREFCGGRNRFTVLQMVDVFKGANTAKVKEFGHDKSSCYALLSSWDKSDIQRLFHKLILEHYLTEEIIVIRDIPQSYLKVGQKAGNLMQRGNQIEFSVIDKKQALQVKKKVEVPKKSKEDEEDQRWFDELQDRCYADLMEVARKIASERHTSVSNLIHMEAIREMSQKLPENEQQMMQIPHITKANFEKFGKQFLDVILQYAAEKLSYQMDREEEREAENIAAETYSSDDDSSRVDWDQLGNQSSSTGNRRGFKRKSGSSWGGKKVLKKYKSSRAKKKTPAKKNTSQKGKAWSASGSSRGGGSKLLPPPKPTF